MTTKETSREQQLPPVPEDVREAARSAPDHWIGVVDPGWRGEGTPPPWAVIGEWRSGESGEVEEWQPNEDYRPSPAALGWPEPADPVDAAVQLAVTGYAPEAQAIAALGTAEITVLRAPDGGPLLVCGPNGMPTVPVFSSAAHQAFAGSLTHDTVPAAELAHRLAPSGTPMTLNPAGPASLVVGPDTVLAALEPAPPGG
ncbi:type VII secretion system-associated protein [Streptomyces sp. NPDC048639]|uniref:type VII secretion system-associated protein n=1 Tax=Streptomyces sp. NPDC048639 TaxID=3365581 RepID=UPI00371339D8